MRNTLINALTQLANNKRIFCSEADFQFALAWEIQKHRPNAQILLENGIRTSCGYYYIDIVVIKNGLRYFIELKYQTARCAIKTPIMSFVLKEQAAEDLMRYDYLWDLHRLYTIKCQKPDFGGGYAIILSNDRLMYQAPSRKSTKTLDAFFRIHERPLGKTGLYPIPGLVAWNNGNKANQVPPHWTYHGSRAKLFSLPPINTHWNDYLAFTDSDGNPQLFKYLINEVGPTCSNNGPALIGDICGFE